LFDLLYTQLNFFIFNLVTFNTLFLGQILEQACLLVLAYFKSVSNKAADRVGLLDILTYGETTTLPTELNDYLND